MIEGIDGRFPLQHLENGRALNRGLRSQEFERLLRQAREQSGSSGEAPGAGARASSAGNPQDRKLMDVCYQMESLFLGTMLDAMRQTVQESDFFGKSMAKDIFRDMLYDEYANLMARTDQIGLAHRIYDRLRDS